MTESIQHAGHALRDLYRRPGPYASVYIDIRATGMQEVRPRWHAVAAELERQGAGAGLLTVVRDRVLAAAPGPGMLAVFASRARVLLAVDMSGGVPRPDLARYEVLPHLLPLLEWLQGRPPHLIAVVDRTGADLTLFPGGAARPVRWTVEGPDDEIERNAPGGWAQGRYQHRAEDSWEHNAVWVVEELVPAVRRYGVRLLVLAGDLRAVQYLEKHLPARVTKKVIVRHVPGGRGQDGSERLRAEQLTAEVRVAVAEWTADLLAEFDEARAPGGRAVEGRAATVEALAQGRVRVLLLAPEPEPGPARPAWFGPSGTDVAADPETLERAGVRPRRGRLVDVAVRAALLTGVEVRILPAADIPRAPSEGIGALCRFT
jgi:Bacterial archaeo-eukaryotic release factor family 2